MLSKSRCGFPVAPFRFGLRLTPEKAPQGGASSLQAGCRVQTPSESQRHNRSEFRASRSRKEHPDFPKRVRTSFQGYKSHSTIPLLQIISKSDGLVLLDSDTDQRTNADRAHPEPVRERRPRSEIRSVASTLPRWEGTSH